LTEAIVVSDDIVRYYRVEIRAGVGLTSTCNTMPALCRSTSSATNKTASAVPWPLLNARSRQGVWVETSLRHHSTALWASSVTRIRSTKEAQHRAGTAPNESSRIPAALHLWRRGLRCRTHRFVRAVACVRSRRSAQGRTWSGDSRWRWPRAGRRRQRQKKEPTTWTSGR